MSVDLEIEEALGSLETLRDFLRWGSSLFSRSKCFFGHGTDNAWDEAVFLARHVLQLPEEAGNAVLDARLLPTERRQLAELFRRRVTERIPAPYLTGMAWFAGLPFRVDSRVIVPRSPIAELIEDRFAPWYRGDDCRRILDLCAGSGCIGIASALQFDEAQVDLVDLSPQALEVARENVALHRLSDRVFPVRSDLFDAVPAGRRYDVILCNPPYVDAVDLAAMPAEFQHEPAMALGSGSDGLDLARRILAQAGDYLSPDGLLVLELGNSGLALEAAYPGFPFTWVELRRGGVGVLVMQVDDLRAWKQADAG